MSTLVNVHVDHNAVQGLQGLRSYPDTYDRNKLIALNVHSPSTWDAKYTLPVQNHRMSTQMYNRDITAHPSAAWREVKESQLHKQYVPTYPSEQLKYGDTAASIQVYRPKSGWFW